MPLHVYINYLILSKPILQLFTVFLKITKLMIGGCRLWDAVGALKDFLSLGIIVENHHLQQAEQVNITGI